MPPETMVITPSGAEHYTLSEFEFEPVPERRYVVFDLEATGADGETDSVTQFGAVAVYDDGPSNNERFTSLVRPWKPIPPEIERLTGITNTAVAGAEAFPAVWGRFQEFCGDAVLVTQCGYEFDFPVLDRECARSGVAPSTNIRLDTKALYALLHPDLEVNPSTNFLSERYGIDRKLFRPHNALGDAMLIARIFCRVRDDMREQGKTRLATEKPVRIHRFILPPL